MRIRKIEINLNVNGKEGSWPSDDALIVVINIGVSSEFFSDNFSLLKALP